MKAFTLLIIFLFLHINVFAKDVMYQRLSDEIHASVLKANHLHVNTFFKEYTKDIKALDSCYTQSQDYFLSDNLDKKSYLKKLRLCTSKAKKLDRVYVKALSYAIVNKDNALFKLLLEVNPSVLDHNRFVEKCIKYYQSIKEDFSFKAGDDYLHKYNNEQKEREIAAQEMAIYEANLKILEYAQARFAKDKDGKLRRFFIGYKKKNQALILIAENKNSYPISVNIEFPTLKNYSVDKKAPYIFVIKSHSVKNIMTLIPKNYTKESRIAWRYSWIMGTYGAVHDDSYMYALPFARNSRVLVSQGNNTNSTHKKGPSGYAVDFAAKVGTRIYAARDGKVIKTEDSFNVAGFDESFAKFANYITIEHSDKTFAQYYHLKQGGVRVKVGEKVSRGEFIGLSGNTGYSSGPHLHFGVYHVVYNKHLSSYAIAVKYKTGSGLITSPKKGNIFESVR